VNKSRKILVNLFTNVNEDIYNDHLHINCEHLGEGGTQMFAIVLLHISFEKAS